MGVKFTLPSKKFACGSVFEILSNDVILELFDYFSSNEIYLSFGNLNNRLDHLIKNYPQHVNFQINRFIPHYIRSLKITSRSQVPLFFTLQSSQLSTIRGLTTGNLEIQQLLDIFNIRQLQQLEYIYLGICRDDLDEKSLLESIQTKILSLGEYRLRRCHLRRHLLVNVKNLPLSLPSLEYIQLDGCQDFSVLSSFLSRMPNLKFLRVSLLDSIQNPLQSVSCRITHLVLLLRSDCSISELKVFFATCCSYVENLIIQPYIENNGRSTLMVSKHEWTNILPSRVTWFYLKTKNGYHHRLSNVHLNSKFYDHIWLMHDEQDGHHCQVIIEEPFSRIW
ncbi:unnamed protein product [Adineta steineri]|uniref:Uncharacterized protein n=2 Tax=Adineta steineri TaxID=433720 RepID=A0A819J6J1_9BILA|nr:unnamed protein product [Adineta steineri]